MSVVAIIQSRMGSTRLPGKALRPILGRPLLWHVIHRLRQSTSITDIVLATSHSPLDDPLAEAAEGFGIAVVRGSEDNVLARFLAVDARFKAETYVRVCGDSPLIDPAFIDHLIEAMQARNADLVTVPGDVPCAHEGVDPFSRRALLYLAEHARQDRVAREHVTSYFKHHPDAVTIAVAATPAALQFRGARLSIDCPADVAFLEAVYQKLGAQAGEASLGDLIALLRQDPSLLAINGHVRQKTTRQLSGTIIIRCDGGARIGFGHVTRMLALGRVLRDQEGYGVVFAMAEAQEALARVRADGFPIDLMEEGADEGAWLAALCRQRAARALICDVRSSLGEADLTRLRQSGVYVVGYDDASERRHAFDLAIYPPVPQLPALAWRAGAPEILSGWQWVVLGSPPVRLPANGDGRSRPRVLVSMGGSDPAQWLVPAAQALSTIASAATFDFVIGPGVQGADAVSENIRAVLPGAVIHVAPETLTPLIASCDMAVVAYGVTAQELAAAGRPAITLCRSSDDAASARAFVEAGASLSLGRVTAESFQRLAGLVRALVDDPQKRAAMARAARRLIDGQGAERVAGLIAQRLGERETSPALRSAS
ncbi:MAG: NTP transferase domain-containing protein [Alphaproteobacteria bacterium]|nr:NTP transferase domain-containing protein [Alphaproteobacteria bacterium]